MRSDATARMINIITPTDIPALVDTDRLDDDDEDEDSPPIAMILLYCSSKTSDIMNCTVYIQLRGQSPYNRQINCLSSAINIKFLSLKLPETDNINICSLPLCPLLVSNIIIGRFSTMSTDRHYTQNVFSS